MSGYSSDEGLMQSAANGSITLLVKPFDLTTLANALQRALDVH